jgi:ribonuclease P protein component
MKKENRLRKNHEFQKVISNNKIILNKYLVIYYLNNKTKKLRVGISVSKKFINAVGRNKLKRQVRSILTIIDDFSKSLDLVIILRKPFLKISFNDKKKIIEKILRRI